MDDTSSKTAEALSPQALGFFGRDAFKPEIDLTALVRIASLICGTPISLVSLVGEDKQWFRAQVGLPGLDSVAREMSFCAHAIQQRDFFEVPDALMDQRFAENPFVTAPDGIRFYAGVPLVLADGTCDGALCVVDHQPRQLDPSQREILLQLAQIATQLLEVKRANWEASLLVAEFKALDQSSPLGIYATDAKGLIVSTNPKWLAIYELDAPQGLGNGWASRVHPQDRSAVTTTWRQAVGEHGDFDMEFRLLLPGDRIRTVRSLARPFKGPDDEVAGHVGSIEDVTEARAMQRRLDLKRNRLASIIEATGAATFEWHVPSGEARVSESWARMTGNTMDDFDGVTVQTWVNQIHPDDRAMVAASHRAHFANPAVPFEFEARKRHVDGHWVWIHVRGRITSTLPDGSPEWISGVQTDVSARKHQEEILRRSESLLAKTGEVAGVGGWDLDLATNALTWTDQTCLIHGLAPGYRPQLEQAINFYAPSSRPVIQSAVETAMVTGQPWDLELQLLQPDGDAIWVRAVGAAEIEDGKPNRLYGAFQNIDERVLQQRRVQEDHKRVTLAKDSGGIGVWEWEPDRHTLTWDRQMFALHGIADDTDLSPADIWKQGLHPDDREAVAAATAQALKTGTRFDAEFRVIHPDGSVRILRSMADASGKPGAGRKLIGVNWDVTEAHTSARGVAEQHRLMRVTMRSIGDAVITTDDHGHVTWLNPVAEMMTGWSMAEAQGRPLAQIFKIINDKTLMPVESPVTACLAKGETVGMADGTILISRDGQEFGIADSAAPIKDDGGKVLGVVLVFHDVTTERRLSGEMTYRATHDPMTGTKNRVEFEQRLDRVLSRSKADGGQHLLLFVDLDHFKLVNDTCGHAAGDEVLRQVAKIMSDSIRTRDTLARLGGDEFGILLEDCPPKVGEQIAQSICDKMEAYRFTHDARRFRIGASIGLVPVDARWTSINAAMQAADTCCAVAKENGRNRVEVWQDSHVSVIARQSEKQWAARLERALEENSFQIYAQTIVPQSETVPGRHVEFLLRMVGDDGEIILPGQFMPSAERFNLASRIDLWVLRQTVAILGHRNDLADFAMISVNLSGRSVGDRAFHRQAIEILRVAGPQICKRLTLEVTETAAVAHIADASVFIEQLHALGSSVAMDDFGAGAASFGYLRSLKVDYLKIDGQFIQGLLDDDLSRATVRCFVEISKVLGIATVAEHVDSPDLIKAVRGLGIDFAQGYLLGRPEPFDTTVA